MRELSSGMSRRFAGPVLSGLAVLVLIAGPLWLS
jgi:hypothetical protein